MKPLFHLISNHRLLLSPESPQATAAPGLIRPEEHRLSRHKALWEHLNQAYARPFGQSENTRPLFASLSPELGPDEILRLSGFGVFIGLSASPTLLEYLDNPGCAIIICEPDPKRFAAEIANFPAKAILSPNVFFLVGDPAKLDHPLSRLLPLNAGDKGFPVFFVQPGLEELYPEYLEQLRRQLEIFHYRHHVLCLMDHLSAAALPLRDYAREESLDQLLHFYANLSGLARQPDLAGLAGAFAGCPAILVGAGPSLDGQFEYIRRNKDKALLIALNNSLKPLLEQDITPHMVVVFDSRLDIERSFAGLPQLPETLLLAHCLAYAGGGRCAALRYFGNFRPDVFGQRPELAAHASVLIAAFSLARLLGASEVVLAGAQFASPGQDGFKHSKFSIHAADESKIQAPDPNMIPVRAANGETLYSLPSYLDAGLWFCDEIRSSGLKTVNLSAQSLIYGPGIILDPDYEIPEGAAPGPWLREILGAPLGPVPPGAVEYLEAETARWLTTREAALAALDELGGERPDLEGLCGLLHEFDAQNISFLLERCERFQAGLVNRALLGADRQRLSQAMSHYFEQASALSGRMLEALDEQRIILKPS